MKKLGFAVVALVVAGLAMPAHAQSGRFTSFGSMSDRLIKAVRERDGTKLNEVLDSAPVGLVNQRGMSGELALNITIARSDGEWTAYLLHKGANPNLADRNGDTPLIVASRVGFGEAVTWLLKRGAKVDLGNRMGETPLIVAVTQRHTPVVRLLLEAGADPDVTDSAAGYSARDYAKRDTRSRQILQLIQAKKPNAAAAAR